MNEQHNGAAGSIFDPMREQLRGQLAGLQAKHEEAAALAASYAAQAKQIERVIRAMDEADAPPTTARRGGRKPGSGRKVSEARLQLIARLVEAFKDSPSFDTTDVRTTLGINYDSARRTIDVARKHGQIRLLRYDGPAGVYAVVTS